MKRITAIWICMIFLFSSTSVYIGASNDPEDIQSASVVTPLSPGPGPTPGAQVYYTDRPTFDTDTGPLPFFEDFEEAYDNVSANGGGSFDAPLDENTNNEWFKPGDIEPGIQFWDNPAHFPGLGVNGPPIIPSVTIYTNPFSDSMDIVFYNNDTWAVGMDLQSYFSPTTFTITIYGVGGVILDVVQAPANSAGIFWGVISDELITRINLYSATTTDGADNIAFGAPTVTINHIDVTPNPAFVIVGESQQFTATAYDEYNNVIPGVLFFWTTNVGSVDATGYFTAQSTPATGSVTATNESVSGSASVTIVEVIFNINLSLGWNLISIPLELVDSSITSVLASINGQWDAVKYYDTLDKADPWKTYRLGSSVNDLANVDETMGFWICITESNVTLTLNGFIPIPTTISLHAGWTLVGYPTQTTETVGNALWGTGADRVEVFDPMEPGLIREVGPTYVMKPGEGYWVHVTSDTTWVINW